MADDARAGALTPEDAERFASAIRPLWDSVQPPDETLTNVVPTAAPSGPRELFGAPNESILGPSPSVKYKVMRASQPPPNEIVPLDRTFIMAPSTPPPPNVGPNMVPAQSPFTKTFTMEGAPPVPNGPFSRPSSDLRFSSPPSAPEPTDSYLMDDAIERPKGRGRGLVVVAVLCGIGVGALLAVRFLGPNTDADGAPASAPSAVSAPSATSSSAIIVVPSAPALDAIPAVAAPIPSAPIVASAVTAVPAVPTVTAAPVAAPVAAQPPPETAKPRQQPKLTVENPYSSNSTPKPRAAIPTQPATRPTPTPAAAPAPAKPAAPAAPAGGITRDAPF